MPLQLLFLHFLDSIILNKKDFIFKYFNFIIVFISTARLVSRYRPKCPIIGVTRNEVAARQMHLWRGLYPLLIEEDTPISSYQWHQDVDRRIKKAEKLAIDLEICKKGDNVVVITEWTNEKKCLEFNLLRIIYSTYNIQ